MSNNIGEQSIIIQPSSIPAEGLKEIFYQMQNCVCKIDNNNKKGTGFFCKIAYNNVILPVLITCNHILNENDIEDNRLIQLFINNNRRRILMDSSRKRYTNKELDITIIEIRLGKDEIYHDKDRNNFMDIDEKVINDNKINLESAYNNESIYAIHYGNEKLSFSCGILNNFEDRKTINFFCDLENYSLGCPILSSKTFKIIGIFYGKSKNKRICCGRFIKYITDEYILKNNISINELELIYKVNKRSSKNIFGEKFVKNNFNNIELIINGEKIFLTEEYVLQKGENRIKLIIKNNLDNLEHMFYKCDSLVNIDGLKYLNVKNINDFSCMFWECSSLYDIEPLENWNVSNVTNFHGMFCACFSLKNLKPLEKWNVSNGTNFSNMFHQCGLLSDLKPLERWNTLMGYDFSFMFYACESLADTTPLQNWNVSNGAYFCNMFCGCSSLTNITSLRNWDVSDGTNFHSMFCGCRKLTDITSLQNWNVSKGEDFRYIFYCCYKLIDIKPLQRWDVSKGKYFSKIFCDCNILSDIRPLENWNVSNGIEFIGAFSGCFKLSDIKY